MSGDERQRLMAEAAALRARLGLARGAATAERQRLRGVFDAFDRDGSGFIERDEFDLLCYQAGAPAEALTPTALQAAFDAIDVSADGRVSFDEFFRWLCASSYGARAAGAASPGERDPAYVRMLRLKLLSRAWYQGFLHLRAEAERDDADPARRGANEERRRRRAEQAAGDLTFRMDLKAGGFESGAGGASVRARFRENSGEADALRAEVECPDGVVCFARLDLALREDADEMEVGELVGMVEVVLDALPWPEGWPELQSHAVDVHEDAATGAESLRITFFAHADPAAFVAQMAGLLEPGEGDAAAAAAAGAAADGSWGDVDVTLELPHDLARYEADRDSTVPLDEVGVRLALQSRLSSKMVTRAEAVVARLPPGAAFDLRRRLAAAEFFRAGELEVRFGSVSEVVSRLPPHTASHPVAEALLAAARQPVGRTLEALMGAARDAASSQAELYNTVRRTLAGVLSLHLQSKDNAVSVDVRGLDFVAFLPPLE